MKTYLIAVLSLLSILPMSAFAAKPLALIYDGPGSCSGTGVLGCTGAAEAASINAGFQVKRVGPSALTTASTDAEYQAIFSQAKVWVQPGGGSRTFLAAATSQLRNAIKRFVSEGGGYVGFCAGTFTATEFDGSTTIPGLGIFPGSTKPYLSESIDTFFDDVTSNFNADALNNYIYEVNWGGQQRHVYFEEGPELVFTADQLKSVEVTAVLRNGMAISARTHYGKGRVYVTGLHPEAPQGWRTHPDLYDADGLDYDLVKNMLLWATGSNTQEKVLQIAPYVAVPTLNDGKYLGITADYETTARRGSSPEVLIGTSELKAVSFDAKTDSYQVLVTNRDVVTGLTNSKTAILTTREFDEQFSDVSFKDCSLNYGASTAGGCIYSSSNTDIYTAQIPFSVRKTVTVAGDGTSFTTTNTAQ